VLIAALATSRGLRAPLSQVADQVFLELSRELEAQGLSRKVSADMFGLALRSYRRRIQRLKESSTENGRSLREAVLDHVTASGVVTRREVFSHFHRDDEAQVGAMLADLCDSGLLFRSGRGPGTAYRAASPADLRRLGESTDGLDEIAWVLIYRDGPLSAAELCDRTRAAPAAVETALERLLREGRVRCDADQRFASERVVLMADDDGAWPAAMFDHYQSLVRTLIARLEADGSSDETGGSTYTLDVFDGHPLEAEVRGTLARLRRELGELWDRVEAENAKNGLPPRFRQVVVYAGQSSREEEK
jgi:hypothetical protein